MVAGNQLAQFGVGYIPQIQSHAVRESEIINQSSPALRVAIPWLASHGEMRVDLRIAKKTHGIESYIGSLVVAEVTRQQQSRRPSREWAVHDWQERRHRHNRNRDAGCQGAAFFGDRTCMHDKLRSAGKEVTRRERRASHGFVWVCVVDHEDVGDISSREDAAVVGGVNGDGPGRHDVIYPRQGAPGRTPAERVPPTQQPADVVRGRRRLIAFRSSVQHRGILLSPRNHGGGVP